MTENETWIENLRDQIIEEDDKILFNETAGCFLSEHYRASYILSWISIIESLKRKINLFSNLGDSRATEAVKEIEKAEEQKKSTDKLIYEEAKKCGILDNSNLSTINYLWEQRCLFAHPYQKQPESDEVKHIIRQSIKLVLGKELLYNKGYLSELSENVATKPFFLPNEIERVREFAIGTIARTPKDLHPFFFKTLLSKVGEVIQVPARSSELTKLRYYLIELFSKTDIPLTDPRWSLENRITKFPYECFLGFVHSDIWDKLPSRIKEMLMAYVSNETESKRLINLKSIITTLITAGVLEDPLKDRYYSKLNGTDYNSSINFYGNNDAKFDRMVAELESWKYELQNTVIEHLKSEGMTDFLNSLGEKKQFYLGRLLSACAGGGHWKTQHYISSIKNGPNIVPNNLIAGLAFASFINRKDVFDLKKESVQEAVKLLNVIDEDIQKDVYKNVSSILENSTPDELDKMAFSEPSLIGISKLVHESIETWVDSNKNNFDKLVEGIKQYFA
jgi:hypothetical protein